MGSFNLRLDHLMDCITTTLVESLGADNTQEVREQIKEQLESLITGYEELEHEA